MSSEQAPRGSAGETLRLLVRPVTSALTGTAAPPPAARPWPRPLRWTERIGLDRVPFGVAVQIFDLLVAVAILFGTFSVLTTERPGVQPVHAFLVALLLAIPVALRERHPLGAWRVGAVAMAYAGIHDWMTVPYPPGGTIAGMLVVYTVASRGPGAVIVGVGLLTGLGLLVIDPATAAGGIVLMLMPMLLGYVVRQRQVSRRELAEQERRHRDAEAVLKERQRIARELHDVVAHHMSMIAIQAEASPYSVQEEVPAKIRQDLAEIRGTALDALTEMRRILGVLRSGEADTAPQPDVDRIGELVESARATGLEVTARIGDDLSGLPPGVGLTAYRILQEAISNVMRHSPGSRVEIEVEHRDGVVWLGIVNGPPAPGQRPTPSPPGSGHGLVGMRERASMLDGELTAAPTTDGGFAVTATLPVVERP